MYIFKEIRDYIFKLLFCNLLEIPLLSDISQQRLNKNKQTNKKILEENTVFQVIYLCSYLFLQGSLACRNVLNLMTGVVARKTWNLTFQEEIRFFQ